MKRVFTLITIISLTIDAWPQIACKVGEPGYTPANADTAKIKISLRCAPTKVAANTIYVVDGVPLDAASLKMINPNDIESVEVLKNEAWGIGCYRSTNPVIIITTKSSRSCQFIVKDILDGSRIVGATVTFINGEDTLMYVADDNGYASTTDLKPGKEYVTTISAIGYKTHYSKYRRRQNQMEEFLLERDVKACSEIVVSAFSSVRQCGYYLYCRVTKQKVFTTGDTVAMATSIIYPNPIQRGRTITIETLSSFENAVKINVTDLSGKLVLTQSHKAFKGVNRIMVNTDSRWTAGIYVVQLVDDRGKTVGQEKLIVQ